MKPKHLICVIVGMIVILAIYTFGIFFNEREKKAEIAKAIYDLKVLQGWWSQYISDQNLDLTKIDIAPTAESLQALAENSGIKGNDRTLMRLLLAQKQGQLTINYNSVDDDTLGIWIINSKRLKIDKSGRVTSSGLNLK